MVRERGRRPFPSIGPATLVSRRFTMPVVAGSGDAPAAGGGAPPLRQAPVQTHDEAQGAFRGRFAR